MNIIDRICTILKKRKLQQKELTEYLNISQSVFSDWKKGKVDSYYKFIPEIAKFLNVSADFLLFGEETHADLSDEEQQIILAYRSQGEEGKKIIRRSLGIEEPTNNKVNSDPETKFQTDLTKAFTKTTT